MMVLMTWSTSEKMVIAPHGADTHKLKHVIEHMRQAGSPTIRAWDNGQVLIAIEGSHRIAAASYLHQPITIDEVEIDDVVEHDIQDLPSPCSVGQIVEYLDGSEYRYWMEVVK
jgi:hypothetical protein